MILCSLFRVSPRKKNTVSLAFASLETHLRLETWKEVIQKKSWSHKNHGCSMGGRSELVSWAGPDFFFRILFYLNPWKWTQGKCWTAKSCAGLIVQGLKDVCWNMVLAFDYLWFVLTEGIVKWFKWMHRNAIVDRKYFPQSWSFIFLVWWVAPGKLTG